MAITVTIAGTDRTERIEWDTLKIENVLTSQVDRCRFSLKRYGGSFAPSVGSEVIVLNGATRVFGGHIVEVEEYVDGVDKLQRYDVRCVDYTRKLDSKLIANVYENMTVDAIIDDMIANYIPTGFSATNVNCPITIAKVSFNWIPISEAISILAKNVNFDWYVDYNKDIHFFDKNGETAPFNIISNDGSYVQGTLVIRRDNSQIRNSIVVKGGEYLGAQFTSELLTNGTDFIFPLSYKYTDFAATLSTTLLDLGIDYLDDPNDFDALHNFNEKILRFKEADTPSAGKVLKVSGKPHLPVIIKVKDQVAIDTLSALEGGGGEYQHLIKDSSIDSKETARQRASAEIEAYGATLAEGSFDTETDGLRSGQKITITVADRGINEAFLINRVSIVAKSPTALYYQVTLVTQRTMGIIEVLRELLLRQTKDIVINPDDIVHEYEGFYETISFSEVVSASKVHNPIAESMVFGETFSATIDYPIDFVYGLWTPSGSSRVGIFGGSSYEEIP